MLFFDLKFSLNCICFARLIFLSPLVMNSNKKKRIQKFIHYKIDLDAFTDPSTDMEYIINLNLINTIYSTYLVSNDILFFDITNICNNLEIDLNKI